MVLLIKYLSIIKLLFLYLHRYSNYKGKRPLCNKNTYDMNKRQLSRIFNTIIIVFFTFIILSFSADLRSDTDLILSKLKSQTKTDDNSKVILGYVTSWGIDLPDPFSVTHLAYAFATINDVFHTLTIKNEDRFAKIAQLKQENPELKILLSVGGWGAGNFSEMASTQDNRSKFISNIMEIVRKYGIDGVDIDWEFPGSSLGKISSSQQDQANFTKLIYELRYSLGNIGILTFASPAYGKFYDYASIIPYVDFVNIMAYDMGTPPKHHSPLNISELIGSYCVKDVVANHYKNGVPVNKIVLGIPFYGREIKRIITIFKIMEALNLFLVQKYILIQLLMLHTLPIIKPENYYFRMMIPYQLKQNVN